MYLLNKYSMILCHLIIFFIILFAFGIESGKIRTNFAEIFGDEWDKNESEEKLLKTERNERNDNSQSASFDQMGEEMGTDPNDQQKREIIRKFEAIKEKLKQKGKFQWKSQTKIERKIGRILGIYREKIYKWKKELNLNKIKLKIMKDSFYEEKKKEFIERFDEFKRLYKGKQKEFAKELGISKETLRRWKKELMPKYYKIQIKHSNEDKLKKMKKYLKIKEKNPKISDEKIAKELEIKYETLKKWKMELLPKHKKTRNEYSDEAKSNNIKKYFQIKEANPKISDKIIAKELEIKYETLRKWKNKLLPNKKTKNENVQAKLNNMKKYFKIKEANPKISDKIIAKKLEIEYETLRKWKNKFASVLEM